MFDIVQLTKKEWVIPSARDWYTKQIIEEHELLQVALEKKGLKVGLKAWDDPEFDWSQAKLLVFRTIWDYFDRFTEFSSWLERTKTKTTFSNSYEIVEWNINKHYLFELEENGIDIPKGVFLQKYSRVSLHSLLQGFEGKEMILKPAVSGSARHTYRVNEKNIMSISKIYDELIQKEELIVQEFVNDIPLNGETSLMLFGGKYSHAVLKKAKPGDFRVQDDHGGSVHVYTPSNEEITFAENTIAACPFEVDYARVDIAKGNSGGLNLIELELIEPELWLRESETAAEMFAQILVRKVLKN